MIVSQQNRSQHNAVAEAHLNGSVHDRTLYMGFFLCHGGRKIQAHFGVVFQRENMLSLKENTHGRTHGIEHTDDGHAVDDVSGKTRYALGDDQIDLSSFRICDHSVEGISFIERCARNTFIGVYFYQGPVVVAIDHILVVILLKLIGTGLLDIVSGYSDIDGNSLVFISVIKVTLLSGGNNLGLVQGMTFISLPDFLFHLGFGQAPGFNFSH